MRRALKGLDGAKDDSVRLGRVRFSSPVGEGVVVKEKARGINAGFEKEDEDALAEFEKKIGETAKKGMEGGKA